MATVIPGKQRSDHGIGEGLANLITSGVKSYQNTVDQSSLRKSIEGLGENASARDILNAITNTHTYSPESKQTVLKNYLGVAKFEELKRKAQETHNLQKEQRKSADAIIDQLDLPEEKRQALKGNLSFDTAEDLLKNQTKQLKSDEKHEERKLVAKAGLETIAEMRAIGKKGNIGRGSQITRHLGGNIAKNYGQYEQLGKSLIQLSTNIPIRNRAEFEVLAHNLYDPAIPDMQRAGILDALENIIKRSVGLGNSNELTDSELKEALPDVASFKNRTITAPNGQKFTSDGTKWTKK